MGFKFGEGFNPWNCIADQVMEAQMPCKTTRSKKMPKKGKMPKKKKGMKY